MKRPGHATGLEDAGILKQIARLRSSYRLKLSGQAAMIACHRSLLFLLLISLTISGSAQVTKVNTLWPLPKSSSKSM